MAAAALGRRRAAARAAAAALAGQLRALEDVLFFKTKQKTGVYYKLDSINNEKEVKDTRKKISVCQLQNIVSPPSILSSFE